MRRRRRKSSTTRHGREVSGWDGLTLDEKVLLVGLLLLGAAILLVCDRLGVLMMG
jgi:hypothetical protein